MNAIQMTYLFMFCFFCAQCHIWGGVLRIYISERVISATKKGARI